MDLNLPEDIQMLKDMVRRFVAEELEPVAAMVESEALIPEPLIESMRGLGLFGMAIPEAYGGLGLSLLGQCAVMEELSRANLAFRILVTTNNGIGTLGMILAGTEEQKRRYLPDLAAGRAIGCFCLTEPEAGSDAASLRTTAKRDGEGYILSGSKIWITNADRADYFTVLATVDRSMGPKGITAFFLPRDTPGLRVGRAEPKMGLHGTNVAEVLLEDCFVPAEARLGAEGEGFTLAMRVLDHGRLSIAASSVGAAGRLVEAMTEHARDRRQFGRPIGANQAIQWMIADSATEVAAARGLVREAAWRKDQGEQVTHLVSMAKLFATEMAGRVADRAVQLHGGMGYMAGNLAERYFRDLRVYRLYEGTSEIQRLIIARHLLEG
ncbi:MAG: acyl-CoA dehydrogenase family protein [Polyangia bacterium]|nr:acyl-CoA dehydrogenase family protein [Polyangia bacterium]